MQCKVQYRLPPARGYRFWRCAFEKASRQVIATRLLKEHLTLKFF
jgi:hypothetical protein